MDQKKLIGNGLTGNQLKIIAIIAMTIDHLTSVIVTGYDKTWWIVLLHIIGRLAAPIMWFMVVEGYRYTSNLKKYIARLFVYSIIAHFAYNFCFGIPFIPFKTTIFNQTSVIWPLAWGVVALYINDEEKCHMKNWQRTILMIFICIITFPSDWSCIAVLAIVYLNRFYGDIKKQTLALLCCVANYAIVYALAIDLVYGLIQLLVVLCIPFMMNYNGRRGNWKAMKWFFYAYYAGHLVICGIIRILMHGNIGVIIGG